MEVALLIGQLLLKYGPDVAATFTTLLHKTDPPKPEEWTAFFALVAKSGESYFPPAPVAPAVKP